LAPFVDGMEGGPAEGSVGPKGAPSVDEGCRGPRSTAPTREVAILGAALPHPPRGAWGPSDPNLDVGASRAPIGFEPMTGPTRRRRR